MTVSFQEIKVMVGITDIPGRNSVGKFTWARQARQGIKDQSVRLVLDARKSQE